MFKLAPMLYQSQNSLEGRMVPCSFLWKIFLVVYFGTQIPLIGVGVYLIMQYGPPDARKLLEMGMVIALYSTAIVLWALYQILRPMERHGKMSGLPVEYRDEVGLLLRRIESAMRSSDFQKRTFERLAAEDHLTALPNRRAAEEHLETCIRELPSTGPLAIALIDIDHFKAINDRFGHAAGDSVLSMFAEYVGQTLHQGDWISRWGGDEFLLIIRGNAREAAGIFDRLCDEIALRHVRHEDEVIQFSVSIGYSMAVPGETWAQSVERADRSLYHAKRNGRSRASSQLRPQNSYHLRMESIERRNWTARDK